MPPAFLRAFRCVLCDRQLGPELTGYTCPTCGAEGILDHEWDHEAAARVLSRASLATDRRGDIFRYGAVLPARPPEPWPGLPVGGTPLVTPPRLATHLGLPGLLVKNDGQLPSGSLKDRASAVAVAQAVERGVDTLTAASTGNAASSVAGLAAAAGLRAVIFVPATAPAPKLAQLRTYGALVVAVQGTYDQAFDLCLEATARYGWYSRNTAFNPVLSEGKKTVSLEILEQLGWQAPDWVAVSVGDGCIVGGVGKGLLDAHALGLIDRVPRILAVQSDGSAAIYNAWKAGARQAQPVTPTTIADSISVGQPRDAVKALRAIRATDGLAVAVSDEAILEAGRLLGRLGGVFAEPAGAASLAGILAARARGDVKPHERVVAIVTGNGLKDPGTSSRGTPELLSIPATVDALPRVEQAAAERARSAST
jgi:threonine synthase